MRICFLGDSFVNGTGDPECLGWVGRICAAARRRGFDLTCYNLGVRRDTSEDLARRWRREASARLPADIDGRLVFSFGVNDCLVENGRQCVSREATLAAAEAMLTEARAWRPTLFVGPPPIADDDANRRIAPLSSALAALCAALEVPYLDAFRPLSVAETWMRDAAAGDGAHPGAAGYALFADLVAGWAPWQAWIAPRA
jgi:lysophospholipase L1-like esterase